MVILDSDVKINYIIKQSRRNKMSDSIDFKKVPYSTMIIERPNCYETEDGKLITWGSNDGHYAERYLKARIMGEWVMCPLYVHHHLGSTCKTCGAVD